MGDAEMHTVAKKELFPLQIGQHCSLLCPSRFFVQGVNDFSANIKYCCTAEPVKKMPIVSFEV